MSVLQHFEEYQKARVKFVQAVAEAATRPQNIEVMNNAGVMQLLRPLLLDNVSNTPEWFIAQLYRVADDVSPGFFLPHIGSQHSANSCAGARSLGQLFRGSRRGGRRQRNSASIGILPLRPKCTLPLLPHAMI